MVISLHSTEDNDQEERLALLKFATVSKRVNALVVPHVDSLMRMVVMAVVPEVVPMVVLVAFVINSKKVNAHVVIHADSLMKPVLADFKQRIEY